MVTAAVVDPAMFPNIQIRDCEIVGPLGQGGMGIVVEARQKHMGNRKVAVKILNPNLAPDPQFAQRFEFEAQALAKLNHANIVTIHDRGTTPDGQMYFIMEYVAGLDGTTPTDLRKVMGRDRLAPDDVRHYAMQICDALAIAHEQGIVHRDIKPGNVLITRGKHVKVADFGIASIASVRANQNQLTAAAVPMGTADYCSPEQRRDAATVTAATDVYSLGVLVYEMLTGDVPRGNYRLPSAIVAGLDPSWDQLVDEALQPEPSERLPGMLEFKNRLQRIGQPDVNATNAANTARPLACPECQAVVTVDTKFCTRCRSQQWLECDKCHTNLHVSVDFCPECSHDISNQKLLLKYVALAETSFRKAMDTAHSPRERCDHAVQAALAARRALNLSASHENAKSILTRSNKLITSIAWNAGDQAYKNKNLSEAQHFFELVLDIDADSPAARRRFEKIRDFRQDGWKQTDDAIASGTPKRAVTLMEKLATMFPDDQPIQDRLVQLRENERVATDSLVRMSQAAARQCWWEVKSELQSMAEQRILWTEFQGFELNLGKQLSSCQPLVDAANQAIKQGKIIEAKVYAQRALTMIADHPRAKAILNDVSEDIKTSNAYWENVEAATKEKRWFLANALMQKMPATLASSAGKPKDQDKLTQTVSNGLLAANRFLTLIVWSASGGVLILLLDMLARLFAVGMSGSESESTATNRDLAYLVFFVLALSVTAQLLRTVIKAGGTRRRYILSTAAAVSSAGLLLLARAWTDEQVPPAIHQFVELLAVVTPLAVAMSLLTWNLLKPPVRRFIRLFVVLILTAVAVAWHWQSTNRIAQYESDDDYTRFVIPALWMFAWMQIGRLSVGWWRTSLVILVGWIASIIAVGISHSEWKSSESIGWYLGYAMLLGTAWWLHTSKSWSSTALLAVLCLAALWSVPRLENLELFKGSSGGSQLDWGPKSFLLVQTLLSMWWMSAAYIGHDSQALLDARLHLADRQRHRSSLRSA